MSGNVHLSSLIPLVYQIVIKTEIVNSSPIDGRVRPGASGSSVLRFAGTAHLSPAGIGGVLLS